VDASQNYKVGGNQGGKLLMSSGNKQRTNAFSNIPGLKDKLRDIGNAMIESPKEAIELATKFGDVSQNALQRGINLLTKGGTYLKGKVDNPVVHYTVDRFLTADGKAKAEISEKLHGEYLASLRELSKEEYHDAFTLLNAADLVGGKVGGAVAKTIQKRNLTEGQWVSNQNIANTKADATVGAAALRPSAAAKAPTDPYIAWNKLGSDARSSRIQGALTSGMNPVTHEPMTDAEREAFKAELAQASRNLDQKSNNLNQGVTADIDPATGKIRIVKKQTPSVSGVSKLSDDDLINKYLPKK